LGSKKVHVAIDKFFRTRYDPTSRLIVLWGPWVWTERIEIAIKGEVEQERHILTAIFCAVQDTEIR